MSTQLATVNDLLASHAAIVTTARETQKARRREWRTLSSPPQDLLRLSLIPSPPPSPNSPPGSPVQVNLKPEPSRTHLLPAKRARAARYANYVPEEETIRNDYSQRYVDGGEWPQDWVLGADPEHRFEEYPKQQRLLALKKAAVAAHALPSTYLPFSQLSSLAPSKFDVIVIDPPFSSSFTWDDLQELPIPNFAADPSFVLLWVGSGAGDGLERGREVLAKWGFRRCEDIVWVKTNHNSNKGPGTDPPTTSLLTRTKQHCLMGIRGTVRRSTDSWFVHCNVDTDVMIWEGDPTDPILKPPEMYTLVENFCLGFRRLEVFGRARTLRRGWVTVLQDGEESRVGDSMIIDEDDATLSPIPWDRNAWEAKAKELANGGKYVIPMTSEIDALRPKSPVRGGSSNNASNTPSAPTPQQGGTMTAPMNMHTNSTPSSVPNRPIFNSQPRVPGMGQGPTLMSLNNMGPPAEMMGWPEGMNMQGLTGNNMMVGMQPVPVNLGPMNMNMNPGLGVPGQAVFGPGPVGNMGVPWGGDGQFGGMEARHNMPVWDDGSGMMTMNGVPIMPMNNMGMHVGMNVNPGMGMNMGQWGADGFHQGFQR